MYRPEVGEECLIEKGRFSISEFASEYVGVPVKVCSYFNNSNDEEMVAVSGRDGGCVCFRVEMIRPLKSKRDEEIANMCSAAKFENLISLKETMSNLYDAGYRKQLPYSLFVNELRDGIIEMSGRKFFPSNCQCAKLAAKLNRTPDEE